MLGFLEGREHSTNGEQRRWYHGHIPIPSLIQADVSFQHFQDSFRLPSQVS